MNATKKEELIREAVRLGIAESTILVEQELSIPKGDAARLVEKLAKRGLERKGVGESRRLVNRFKVGADPEFCLYDVEGEAILSRDAGLDTGEAFGADLNGRLAELRPMASRSVLDVLASTLASMRWMAMSKGMLMGASWDCGAVTRWGDGVGGHVHFGRKRQSRKQEILALDALSKLLSGAGIFDEKGLTKRAAETGYGGPGDLRLTKYGYEYRSFPSWLDAPYMAFLVLTLAKLAVHDPELFLGEFNGVPSTKLQLILNYYKSKDDDALLACRALGVHSGLPRWVGGDFKARWGIKFPLGHLHTDVSYFPGSIVPEGEVQEIFSHLAEGRTIAPRAPVHTWTPTKVPDAFLRLTRHDQGVGSIGLGEVLRGLVYYADCPGKYHVRVRAVGGESLFMVFTPFPNFVREKLQELRQGRDKPILGNLIVKAYDSIRVDIPPHLRAAEHTSELRKFLTSGLFPIWRVEDNPSKKDFMRWKLLAGTKKAKPTDKPEKEKQLMGREALSRVLTELSAEPVEGTQPALAVEVSDDTEGGLEE